MASLVSKVRRSSLLHKQGEIYFPGTVTGVHGARKAQPARRFLQRGTVRPLLWGFGRNGNDSVALQGGLSKKLSTRKILRARR
jgi:hypothetical protein